MPKIGHLNISNYFSIDIIFLFASSNVLKICDQGQGYHLIIRPYEYGYVFWVRDIEGEIILAH